MARSHFPTHSKVKQMTQLPQNKEEFFNEGACAILDLASIPFSRPEFLRARRTFEGLPLDEQVSIIARANFSSPCFDPTVGKMVCFCCGKDFFQVHGRRFNLH